MHNVLKIIEKIFIFISIIAILNGISIAFLYAHKSVDDTFKFGDYYLVPINDNSMTSEFKLGDLIILKSEDPNDYHINNIIGYYVADKEGNISTRVSKILDGYSNDSETSYVFYVNSIDSTEEVTISGGDVVGEWTGGIIINGGNLIKRFVSKLGLFIFTICPLIMQFLVEFILLIVDYLKIKQFNGDY